MRKNISNTKRAFEGRTTPPFRSESDRHTTQVYEYRQIHIVRDMRVGPFRGSSRGAGSRADVPSGRRKLGGSGAGGRFGKGRGSGHSELLRGRLPQLFRPLLDKQSGRDSALRPPDGLQARLLSGRHGKTPAFKGNVFRDGVPRVLCLQKGDRHLKKISAGSDTRVGDNMFAHIAR
mgnify:CR=1 FL=1